MDPVAGDAQRSCWNHGAWRRLCPTFSLPGAAGGSLGSSARAGKILFVQRGVGRVEPVLDAPETLEMLLLLHVPAPSLSPCHGVGLWKAPSAASVRGAGAGGSAASPCLLSWCRGSAAVPRGLGVWVSPGHGIPPSLCEAGGPAATAAPSFPALFTAVPDVQRLAAAPVTQEHGILPLPRTHGGDSR